jgi:hypothetical protein
MPLVENKFPIFYRTYSDFIADDLLNNAFSQPKENVMKTAINIGSDLNSLNDRAKETAEAICLILHAPVEQGTIRCALGVFGQVNGINGITISGAHVDNRRIINVDTEKDV